MEIIEYKPIGKISSPFKDRHGIPRQGVGAPEVQGTIEVFEQFAPGLKDLEGFSHIVVIFHLHLVENGRLTAHPPWDGKEHGVFATRSPYRPNPIGVSVVKLEKMRKNILHVSGLDMADGSPVLDIKPYIPELNPKNEIRLGWLNNKVQGMTKSKSGDR